MIEGPRKQDWAVLGVKPGTRPAEVERAYQRRRALYERESLATYTLLSDDERSQMLERLDLAYCNILGKRPTRSPKNHDPLTELARMRADADRDRIAREAEPAGGEPARAAAKAAPEPAEAKTDHEDTAPAVTEPTRDEPALDEPEAEPIQADEQAKAEPLPQEPPLSEPEPDRHQAPGEYLRHHRRCRDLTVDDVAHETKIRAWQINKIENEDHEDLPAQVYIRGFVIQYARFLELPEPEELAQTYLQRVRSTR